MAKARIILEDDNGRIIGTQTVEVEVGNGSFHDVEGAVEALQRHALPKVTQQLLAAQQHKLRTQKKDS